MQGAKSKITWTYVPPFTEARSVSESCILLPDNPSSVEPVSKLAANFWCTHVNKCHQCTAPTVVAPGGFPLEIAHVDAGTSKVIWPSSRCVPAPARSPALRGPALRISLWQRMAAEAQGQAASLPHAATPQAKASAFGREDTPSWHTPTEEDDMY